MRTLLYTVLAVLIAGVVGFGSHFLFGPEELTSKAPSYELDTQDKVTEESTVSKPENVGEGGQNKKLAKSEISATALPQQDGLDGGSQSESTELPQPQSSDASVNNPIATQGEQVAAPVEQEPATSVAADNPDSPDESLDEVEEQPYSAYEDDGKKVTNWDDIRTLETSSIVSRVVKQGEVIELTETTQTDDDYEFPTVRKDDSIESGDEDSDESTTAVNTSDDTPETDLSIPEGDLPDRNSRRLIVEGDGPLLGPGSIVRLSWDMFSWSTGNLIESTKFFDQPFYYTIGGFDNLIEIPVYLRESIVNRTAGSRIMVVFGRGMEDLPGQFDPNDAYVLLVDINY